MKTDKNTNRLIHEKSPYLLQHAHNPVDWYPWGDEAFQKARSEDKPIFLSIGYSTCHWCHVMERESFEDDEVAEALNKYYISIKVDREERPDIDSIYMTVCQAMTGRGGWPLTVFLTPEAKPFYSGTYFPKHDRLGMPGFLSILRRISAFWRDNREELLAGSDRIMKAIKREFRNPLRLPNSELIERAYDTLRLSFDSDYGGFGRAPKFPMPHNLIFLLRYWYLYGESHALKMVEKTLESMYRGGIFDHIGFGFSRYSTDDKWLVPHFEKMLYDNALLAVAYTEAYKAAGKDFYADVAKRILTYLLRDMASPEGAFYSAEDADSEGEEGKYFIWTLDEVRQVLGEKDGERFARFYDITERGNFEGANVLNKINIKTTPRDEDFAERCRQFLFEHRERRQHPFKDKKILTAWNGLAIAALAIAARTLDEPRYAEHAQKAVEFILKRLVRQDGRLMASYCDGETQAPAFAEDYAFLIWGLIELYESTYRPEYLKEALRLNDALTDLFWDEKDGGLFIYGRDAEQLIMRPKESYDGALPSGNSVAALNFLRLSHIAGRAELEALALKQFDAFGPVVSASPASHAFFLMAVMYYEAKPQEVIITGDYGREETREMVRLVHRSRNPFISSVVHSDERNGLKDIIPHIENYKVVDGNPAAYICRDYACRPPITDLKEFEGSLDTK